MQNRILWTITFLTLFVLSLDFWGWNQPISLQALGLPSWVYYFVLLQLLFAAVFFAFSRIYWRDPADKDGEA